MGLGEVVVVDPAFVAGVVGRVDVDALDLAGVGGEEGLEGEEVVAFDDEVAIEAGLFALWQERQLGVELQAVMGHGVVVGLDDRLAFEL